MKIEQFSKTDFERIFQIQKIAFVSEAVIYDTFHDGVQAVGMEKKNVNR
ncbi:MAG: hypothetical protein JW798_04780 [Prolixibacteraceae bacterium]|nr:hypothetical protein [Prolixibacteraceae bacterium]